MKKFLNILLVSLLLFSCSSKNFSTFGRGVSITFDPRTVGMQIDDTLMQKSLDCQAYLGGKKIFYINTS